MFWDKDKNYTKRTAKEYNIWRTIFQFIICKIFYMIRLKLVYRLEVYGLENVPKDNEYIVCPNHLSTLDPPMIAGILPRRVSFMAKKELFDIVFFLGYRNDVPKLTGISDIAFSASKREGLPINIVEAMACGIPIVASNIRGHRDAVQHGRNGFLFDLNSPDDMVRYILELYHNKELCKKIKENNVIDARKFSVSVAVEKMAKIYKSLV